MYTSHQRGRLSPALAPAIGDGHAGGSSAGYIASELRIRARAVREVIARYSAYEEEGSERRALGSVGVTAEACWRATLTVPITDRVAFVHLERSGALPVGYRGGEESAFFSLPVEEAEALVALLAGVVAQASRDGVLPDRRSDRARQ